jgi:nucleoside phosphorylase
MTGQGLLVCAALGIEARALRTDGLRVERVGMGVRRAEEFARRLPDSEPFDVLAVAGFGGAAFDALRPGDVVVADEVRRGDEVIECPWAPSVAAALEQHLVVDPEAPDSPHGITTAAAAVADRRAPAVVVGPVATVDRIADAETLARLAAEGVTAVDMESFPLVAAARGRPFAVVRVVVDTPDHPLLRLATLRAGLRARKRLRSIGTVLRDWATALEHV